MKVITAEVRSNLLEGDGVIQRQDGRASERKRDTTTETEIDYVTLLNRVLPRDIVVLAWCPVSQDFSARFSCVRRTYKYYFPQADLDLARMQEAASLLRGTHDFRNLCKMDVLNGVTKFVRRIEKAEVRTLDDHDALSGFRMCELTITGNAFLYHQIRSIVCILFLIGRGEETVSVVTDLLDVERNPRKPQYTIASGLPLVLFDCEFPDLTWRYVDQQSTLARLQLVWSENTIRATIAKQMHDSVEAQCRNDHPAFEPVRAQLCGVQLERVRGKPLLKRQKAPSLDDKIEAALKKQKLRQIIVNKPVAAAASSS